MKLWVLAIARYSTSELSLLVHPIVQLASGVVKLSTNIKYFPFHLKIFKLMNFLTEKSGQFIPFAQYILYPFDVGTEYLNSKPKQLHDK